MSFATDFTVNFLGIFAVLTVFLLWCAGLIWSFVFAADEGGVAFVVPVAYAAATFAFLATVFP